EDLLGGLFSDTGDLGELGGGLLEQVAESRDAGLDQALGRLLADTRDVAHRDLAAARGLEHPREGLGHLALDLALALDLDLQADQRGGEADVLTLLADRERELV